MTKTTNILLVDDHPMFRQGLRLVIETEEGLNVIGEANDGQEAIDLVCELTPDIVIMDINMPNLNGIEATKKILVESPQTKVLALSIHSGKRYVENMLEAGASGYLLKESAPEELIKAIRIIDRGKAYLSADITEIVLSKIRQEASPAKNSALQKKKLQRPVLASTIIRRSKLIQQLEAGREKKLTLVTAPEGYGKTTLVSDWLANCDTPRVWLSLDKDDNDLRLFLRYLLASIRNSFPEACPNVNLLVDAANLPPISILVNTLVNDFEQIRHRFILILDDYHLIKNKSHHELISQLLKHPLRQVHLVIISSRYPFLPVSTLRANSEISEIKVNELLFSLAETTIFLERFLEQDIDAETASYWQERTDGWVTGLQLAIYTNQHSDVVDESVPADSSSRIEAAISPKDWLEILTNREHEILLLLDQRLRDKEIANQMCISTETVKSHLKNLYKKLHATDRRNAVVKAVKFGILKKT